MRQTCGIIWFVIMSTTAVSQSIHNSSMLFVPKSVSIYSDDFENDGFVQNNGTIEVTGNWNNHQVYQGLGSIILSGTDQSISNNDQAIEDLLISGGGTKSVDGKLTINGSIQFAAGIVEVDSRDALLVRKDASIEGGSASSFVDGALAIEGTGYKFFPVGRGGSYYPVLLPDVRGMNPTTQITAHKDLPFVKTLSPVEVDQSVYWTLNTISGKFNGSRVAVGYHAETDEPERIVFVVADDVGDEFSIVDNDGFESSNGTDYITSNEVINQSIIAMGTLPEKPALPGYLSTTMSPNASNPDNRFIKVFGPDIRSDNFHFHVVNRWGNVIFESRSLADMTTEGWDGRHGGQLVPAGAYPYRLSYADRKGKAATVTGFITIIY